MFFFVHNWFRAPTLFETYLTLVYFTLTWALLYFIRSRKLSEEEVRLSSQILTNVGEGVCLIRALDQTIVYTNPRLDQMYGYAAGELMGQPMRKIHAARASQWEDLQKHINQSLSLRGGWAGEMLNAGKNGKLSWCWVTISTFEHLVDGTLWVVTHSDITARKQTENELIRARESALQALRFKSEFVANMSHEIRTPMNAVIGMAGLLMNTRLNSTQRDYAHTIMYSAEALLILINDVLDFSKMEAGKLALEVTDFDLSELLRRTQKILRAKAKEKALKLSVELSPEVPQWLRGDSGRLAQVLTNLLANAVKFTESGTVSLRVLREERRNAADCIRFEVSDTGIGIDKDVLSRLFKPFTQADASMTRKYGGTGLGLSICKRLVEMMEGEIGVESEVGKGSTFWFTIPLLIGASPSQKLPSEPFHNGAAAAARILVAENNPINQRVTSLILEGLGYQVQCVGNGREAIDALMRFPFDIVLMDCRMSEMDGFQAMSLIRKLDNPKVKNIPIIALTADGSVSTHEHCFLNGANDVLTKPFRTDTLASVIDRWLRASETKKAA